MNHLSSAIAEDHLYAGIKYVIVKGTVKLTGKLVRMKCQHSLAETACSVGLVHLVDPKLALYFMDKIDKRVGIYNAREDFNSFGE
jgi:hypothetical protein